MKSKRMLSVLLSAVLASGAFAGCSDQNPEETTSVSAQTGGEPAAETEPAEMLIKPPNTKAVNFL